mmetsp:Transcript_12029/g.28816  ORF Transcript_12029/g.28816 Transcript_12029/m.28816 type:complete len:263 (-) Transcript_12029:577-1365(-)
MQEQQLWREMVCTRGQITTGCIILYRHVPQRSAVVCRSHSQHRFVCRMPIHRANGLPVPFEVGHRSCSDMSGVPNLETPVIGTGDDQLTDDGAPAEDIHIGTGVSITHINCCFLSVLLPDIPHLPAAIGAARSKAGLGSGTKLLPLDILDRGFVHLEGLRVHLPASRHGLRKQDQRIVASRKEQPRVVWAEIHGETLIFVGLARKDGLGLRRRPIPALVKRFSMSFQVPHVHLAGIGPGRHDVTRLRHGAHPIDAARMRSCL